MTASRYAKYLFSENKLINKIKSQKINEIKTHLCLKIVLNLFSSTNINKKIIPVSDILISGIAGPAIRENGKIKIKKKEKFLI